MRPPPAEADKQTGDEFEERARQTEKLLAYFAAKTYSPSEVSKREQRLDVAKAESVRLAGDIFKFRAMFAEAKAKQGLAEYRYYDFDTFRSVAMRALKYAVEDQATATEQPLESVKAQAYSLIRRTYNARVDKMLVTKQVLDDPRKVAELWTRAMLRWYSPSTSS